MKQVFLASTYFQVVCLSAGIDAGEYDRPPHLRLYGAELDFPEWTAPSERILLLSNNAQVLELTAQLDSAAGLAPALRSFDRIVHLNEAIAPTHPSSWVPQEADLPMLRRFLGDLWDLREEPVELVLESPQVNPAIALGRVFRDSVIRVHSDGLMSYGPTRNKIPLGNGQRVSTLHHLPLVEGVTPRLLDEFDAVAVPLSVAAFRAKVAEVAEAIRDELSVLDGMRGPGTAFAVGQYLAALGLLSEQEEEALHVSMIQEAADRGFDTLVFKPHPAAPPATLVPLHEAADRLGIRLVPFSSPAIAEAVFEHLEPGLVLGCFSTALATARRFYGIPVLALGTEILLERITPFQNSNRIPVTLMRELADGTARERTPVESRELQSLVDAVGYAMLSEVVPHFRSRATEYLSRIIGTEAMIYFKRRRLSTLGLPGGRPERTTVAASVRRTGRLGVNTARFKLREARAVRKAKRA